VGRQYKTLTGTYTEEELAIVVWMNPKSKSNRQSRALETMTSETSSFPMAFPIKSLVANRSWRNATFVHTREEVYEMIQNTKRTHPLVVPLEIAKLAWGWDNFYVPSEYVK
jgi:hypothetical protein